MIYTSLEQPGREKPGLLAPKMLIHDRATYNGP